MQKVLILGAFFITARILTPADFGVIALAAIYPTLLDSITAIGFEAAMTQKALGEERPYLHTVWTFNLLRGILIFFIVYLTAPYITPFFHAENVTLLFRLSALFVLFQGMSNIGYIYFFRNLDFKKVFLRDLANYGTTAFVTVLSAMMLHSYWAIFIGNTMGILAATLSTYFLSQHRPKLDLQLNKLKPLLGYSQWIFGQGMVNNLTQTLENTLVGHLTDATSVGFYGKAKSLAYAPTSPLGNIISKVGFSAFVAAQGSLPHMREGFYKSFDLAVTVALPFAVLMWFTGEKLVLIMLGSLWLGITPLLTVLVIVAALNTSILSLSSMVLNALEKPNYYFRLNLLSLICAIIFLPILTIEYGISGAAYSLLISAIVVNGYAVVLINKTLTPSWRRGLESVLVVTMSIFVLLPVMLYLLHFSFANTTVGFLVMLFVLGAAYIFCVTIFGKVWNKGPYQTLVVIARSFKRS